MAPRPIPTRIAAFGAVLLHVIATSCAPAENRDALPTPRLAADVPAEAYVAVLRALREGTEVLDPSRVSVARAAGTIEPHSIPLGPDLEGALREAGYTIHDKVSVVCEDWAYVGFVHSERLPNAAYLILADWLDARTDPGVWVRDQDAYIVSCWQGACEVLAQAPGYEPDVGVTLSPCAS